MSACPYRGISGRAFCSLDASTCAHARLHATVVKRKGLSSCSDWSKRKGAPRFGAVMVVAQDAQTGLHRLFDASTTKTGRREASWDLTPFRDGKEGPSKVTFGSTGMLERKGLNLKLPRVTAGCRQRASRRNNFAQGEPYATETSLVVPPSESKYLSDPQSLCGWHSPRDHRSQPLGFLVCATSRYRNRQYRFSRCD